MNDGGSGPLSAPIRIAAAVLGAALSVGGAVMIVGGIMSFPRLWMTLFGGIGALSFGVLFIRAAINRWSPAWPD